MRYSEVKDRLLKMKELDDADLEKGLSRNSLAADHEHYAKQSEEWGQKSPNNADRAHAIAQIHRYRKRQLRELRIV